MSSCMAGLPRVQEAEGQHEERNAHLQIQILKTAKCCPNKYYKIHRKGLQQS